MKAALPVLLALVGGALPARASERYAVVVGNNLGDRRESPLRYAEDDAVRVADALTSVGGFDFENVIVMRSPDAAAMRQAILGLNERLRAVPGTSERDSMLLVYYSGHSDASALHLGETPLELLELERLVRSSPARFRVLVADSCRSGALTRAKGGRPGLPVTVKAEGLGSSEGVVVLTAAAAGEDAQESEALQGSFFTHHLVSGLLGAADDDDDGGVTLAEAYRYAHDHTLRDSSATVQGPQHPSYRYDVSGSGDIVLSRVREGRGRGRLVLPPGLETLVFSDTGAARAVAEARRGDAAGVLLLREGRYLVRARGPRVLFEGPVQVLAGATTTVDLAKLDRIEYARLARKGGGRAPSTFGVGASGWLRSGITGSTPCIGGLASADFVLGGLTLRPRVGACVESMSGELTATTLELHASLALHYVLDLPLGLAARVGPDVGASYLRQRVDGTGSRAGVRGLVGPTVGVEAGLDWNLPWGLTPSVTGFVRTYILPVEGPERAPAVSAIFTAGAGVAVHKFF
jgi:hypothetical protein